MPKTFNRAFVVAAALVAGTTGLAAAAPAFAADDVRTITVDYKDLDVHSATGQKALASRVSVASDRVCAQDGADLATRTQVQACKVSAKAQARDALNKAGVPAI